MSTNNGDEIDSENKDKESVSRVRKSSLAAPKSGPRKKSIVSFDENTTTTIEYVEPSQSDKIDTDKELETTNDYP